jgi:transposase
MTGTRKRYSAAFKARVALEAAKQTRTLAELSKTFQVHPVQISQWKKQLLDGVESLFVDGRRRERDESLAIQAEPYEQVRRLNMEVEWLKKKLPAGADLKRPLVEPDNHDLSIRRQCELLGLFAVLSLLPVTTRNPSGLNDAEVTPRMCPLSVRTSAPLRASQTFAVLSQLAVTTRSFAPDEVFDSWVPVGEAPCLRSEDILGQLGRVRDDRFGLAEKSPVLRLAGDLRVPHDLSQPLECRAGRLYLAETVLGHRQEGEVGRFFLLVQRV